jgi:hypothetical protein
MPRASVYHDPILPLSLYVREKSNLIKQRQFSISGSAEMGGLEVGRPVQQQTTPESFPHRDSRGRQP